MSGYYVSVIKTIGFSSLMLNKTLAYIAKKTNLKNDSDAKKLKVE